MPVATEVALFGLSSASVGQAPAAKMLATAVARTNCTRGRGWQLPLVRAMSRPSTASWFIRDQRPLLRSRCPMGLQRIDSPLGPQQDVASMAQVTIGVWLSRQLAALWRSLPLARPG